MSEHGTITSISVSDDETQLQRPRSLSHYSITADIPTKSSHSTQFWTEYLCVCFVVLLSESSRGLVIPTLSSYVNKLGGSELIVSAAVSLYSIGRLLMTGIFGYCSDRYTTRTLLQFSMIICIIGNIIYISADIAGVAYNGLYLLLLSRALTGCGTAVMSVARAHVASTTDITERTTFMSYLGIVSFIGFSFSPALGGLGFESSFAGIPIAPETISTYILAILDIILAIVMQLAMSSVMKSNRVPSHKKLNKLSVDNTDTNMPLPMPRQSSYPLTSHASVIPWIYVILNLTGRGVLSISETYATMLYYQVAGDSSTESQRTAGYWFTVFGVCGVVVNMIVPYMERYITDLMLLKLSLTTGGIGFVLLCSWNGIITYTQYICGMIMIWGISCPLNQTLAVSMLSKHLGDKKQNQWMALVTASGSVGRIICPLITGGLISYFHEYQQNSAYIFAVVLTIISYVLTSIYLHIEVDETSVHSNDKYQSPRQPLLQHSPVAAYNSTNT